MFDIFGIGKLEEYYREKMKRDFEIREMVFDTVKESNEFLFKILKEENSKAYWDWRLDFDKKRYGIK